MDVLQNLKRYSMTQMSYLHKCWESYDISMSELLSIVLHHWPHPQKGSFFLVFTVKCRPSPGATLTEMVDGDAEGSGNLINKICAKAAGISLGSKRWKKVIFFQFLVGCVFFFSGKKVIVFRAGHLECFVGADMISCFLAWFFRFFSVHLYAPKG